MTRAFADTSFYLALLNPKDAWHAVAAGCGERYHGAVITAEYILLEVGNHLCAPADR